MWVSALFGMMTKYAETLLAVRFRKKNPAGAVGRWRDGIYGGWSYEKMVGKRVWRLAVCSRRYGMGNMTQANAIADALQDACSVSPWVTGIVLAAVACRNHFRRPDENRSSNGKADSRAFHPVYAVRLRGDRL